MLTGCAGFSMLFVISPMGAAAEKHDEGYRRAVAVAATIDDLVKTARLQYTRIVVNKLEKEGTGSALHYNKKCFVPLPAQFVRSIANVKRESGGYLPEYQFALRSYWNINKAQDLQGDFEKQGWKFLLEQQARYQQTGKSLRYLKWLPYIKMLQTPEGRVLRYFGVDIASSLSCVNCHNRLEASEDIMQYRLKQGKLREKEFELYELLGAISIDVKIDEPIYDQGRY